MEDSQPIFPEAGPSTSHSRPSLFELLAQEQLRDLLHPVVRYILSVGNLVFRLSREGSDNADDKDQYFAQRYPRYLLRLLNHHEEFFAVLLLLLERHHLKKHSQSTCIARKIIWPVDHHVQTHPSLSTSTSSVWSRLVPSRHPGYLLWKRYRRGI